MACAYLGIAYKATLGKTHVAELRWLPRCCSDKDASMLVAPDFAAKKRRQRYAYLGGWAVQLSVASTTLLENIVVRVKSWAVLLRLPPCAQPGS